MKVDTSNHQLVTITATEIRVSAQDIREVKLALKELKLKKKGSSGSSVRGA
jgi:hypothetical protein